MKILTHQEELICNNVMGRIADRRMKVARIKASVYGFFLISALVAIGPSVQYAAAHAAASGFNDYMSLIISDGSRLSGSWGSLMLSLAQSVPLLGIIFTVAALTAAGYFAQKFVVTKHSLSRPLYI